MVGLPSLQSMLHTTPPATLLDALAAEEKHLRDPNAPTPPDLHAQRLARNRAAYSALCLSGGGIRSASFALGVVQGLAAKGLLTSFDYLSSVSGGGFTGGWLAAWLSRAGPQTVARELSGAALAPGETEPAPVRRMRMYSRYMSPMAGVLSIDGWTLVATMLRNLVLNWLVLVPLIAAALLVPRLYEALLLAVYNPVQPGLTLHLWNWTSAILVASLALIARGFVFVGMNLPSYGDRRRSQHDFLVWCHLPICAGLFGLTIFWSTVKVDISLGQMIGACLAAGMVPFVLTTLAGKKKWRPRSWAGSVVSSFIVAIALWSIGNFFEGREFTAAYAMFAFPLLMFTSFVNVIMFVGIAGRELGDGDLEWYSRAQAWTLVTIVAWMAATALVLYIPLLSIEVSDRMRGIVAAAAPALTATSGVVLRMLLARRSGSAARKIGIAAAGPAFAFLLLGLLSLANWKALTWMLEVARQAAPVVSVFSWLNFAAVLLLGAVLTTLGLGMGRFVRVNKFSLHGMYRERVIRAFLGASRSGEERSPNPFTGFDPADDLEMSQLTTVVRPMLVINMTLNKIAAARLANLQRKAESFTATPLHVGAASLGYRPVDEYGANRGNNERGLSLGNAMTISGAAASSNMGNYSSPTLTFLLTLFNARLGAWLGNPASRDDAWRKGDPKHGLAPLLDEMLGRTTDHSRYVYLSDGGHFDNLGLWEMIQRRCRYILVSDAGCDPEYTFEDLADAIRQVRIDHGVPIVFPEGCTMTREGQAHGNAHYAVGRVLYSAIDGPEANDGILIYVKATLCGQEPVDVLTYSKSHPEFPHESTANQWFDESQFESYRMLGFHTVHHMSEGLARDGSLDTFFEWIEGRTEAAPISSSSSPASPSSLAGRLQHL